MVRRMIKKVEVIIKTYKDSETPDEETLEFTDEGLDMLLKIDEVPKDAILIALQLAHKLRDYGRSFTVQSQRYRGDIEVPGWKAEL